MLTYILRQLKLHLIYSTYHISKYGTLIYIIAPSRYLCACTFAFPAGILSAQALERGHWITTVEINSSVLTSVDMYSS